MNRRKFIIRSLQTAAALSPLSVLAQDNPQRKPGSYKGIKEVSLNALFPGLSGSTKFYHGLTPFLKVEHNPLITSEPIDIEIVWNMPEVNWPKVWDTSKLKNNDVLKITIAKKDDYEFIEEATQKVIFEYYTDIYELTKPHDKPLEILQNTRFEVHYERGGALASLDKNNRLLDPVEIITNKNAFDFSTKLFYENVQKACFSEGMTIFKRY